MTKPRTSAGVCSRIGLALFAMMLVWYVAVNGITMAAGYLAPALVENAWFLWAVNDVPLYVLGLPVFLLLMARLPDGPDSPRYRPPFGAGRFMLVLLFCLGAGYLLNLLAGLVLELLTRIFPGGSAMNMLEQLVQQGGWLPSLLFGTLVPAVGEEFIFRYMLRRKLRGSGDKIYIFFSAFCFSLFHANFVQIPYTFVIGVALAWMYTLTGRLWISMLAHFIINLLGTVVMPTLMERWPWVANLFSVVVLFVLIPAAAVLFFVFRRRALVAMQPPTEPGWPYRQTRPLWNAQWQRPAWPADPSTPPVPPEPPGRPKRGARSWPYGYGQELPYWQSQVGSDGYVPQPAPMVPPAYAPHTVGPVPSGWQAAPPVWGPDGRPLIAVGQGTIYGVGVGYPAGPAAAAVPPFSAAGPGSGPVPSAPTAGSPYGVYRPLEEQLARQNAAGTVQQAPATAPTPGMPGGGHYGHAMPGGPMQGQEAGAVSVCLGNLGVVLYMLLAGLMMLVGLAGMLLI